jgi:hypothetical protein
VSGAGALKVADFCRTYAVCRSVAYQLISAGQLDARKAGRSTLITRDSAERWFESLPAFKPN